MLGCPTNEPAGHPKLTLKVVYWCALPTPFQNQAQFKFKIRVTNTGRTPLDLSQTHWRLLLTSFAVKRWVPPRIGQPTERPLVITYGGRHVWAVPANANRAYDFDANTGYAGFATHWDVPSYLAPGRSFFDAAKKRGDLAYYVPATSATIDENGNLVLHGFIGLAYVHDGRVIALAPRKQWGRRLPANAF